MARDVYDEITNRILAMMETAAADGSDWLKPWKNVAGTGMPRNLDGRPYSGINLLVLFGRSPSNTWGTFKAWQAKGAQVNKGEKGTLVIFYAQYPDKNDPTKTFRLARGYTVFSAEQVSGYTPPTVTAPTEFERDENAEHYILRTGATIQWGGNQASYIPAIDTIRLPERHAFRTVDGFYSTAFHELIHWTGTKDRCDRDLSGRFGDESYAMEELVAELGAAFTCCKLNVTKEPREDHARYLNSWIKRLKQDKRAIFTAASKAQEACRFLDEITGHN